MTNLTTITNGTETITSMEVAEMIGKEHKHLLRDIRRYLNQMSKSNENNELLGKSKIGLSDFFQESTYVSEQNKELPCFNVTKKGCEFIAHKLTSQRGTEFTATYINRFHELQDNLNSNNLIASINSMVQSLNVLTDNISSLNDRVMKLEESKHTTSTDLRKYSHWKKKAFEKLNMITDYTNKNSDESLSLSNIMNIIFNQMQDIYDIDLLEYTEMYKLEFSIDDKTRVHTLDVISHYKDIRDMFDCTIDTILEKLGISIGKLSRNIFDELAEKNKNQNIEG